MAYDEVRHVAERDDKKHKTKRDLLGRFFIRKGQDYSSRVAQVMQHY